MPDRNPYFGVQREPAVLAGPRWRAAATIVRGDTGEPVAHLAARGETSSAAEAQLDAAIAGKLGSLEKPGDWGRDATVFRLVQRYLQHRQQLYGMVERAREADGAQAGELRTAAEAFEREELTKLADQLARLTEAQCVELATPSPEQAAQPDDPWVLEILTAKKRLYQLAFAARRPSPAVEAGYARLEQALNS